MEIPTQADLDYIAETALEFAKAPTQETEDFINYLEVRAGAFLIIEETACKLVAVFSSKPDKTVTVKLFNDQYQQAKTIELADVQEFDRYVSTLSRISYPA